MKQILFLILLIALFFVSCPVNHDPHINENSRLKSLKVAGRDVILGEPSQNMSEAAIAEIYLTATEASVGVSIEAEANSDAASISWGKTVNANMVSVWDSRASLLFSSGNFLIIRVTIKNANPLYYRFIIKLSTSVDYSVLKINEVSGVGDDNQKFYELINTGNNEINLEGCKLYYHANAGIGGIYPPVDSRSLTWTGIASQSIPAGGIFSLVGRNTTGSFTTGLTAARILVITLEDPEGTVIDQCIRAEDTGQYAIGDMSFSRIPDGIGPFYFTVPTVNAPNGSDATGLLRLPQAQEPPSPSNNTLLIFQIGAPNSSGSVSHSFIELYNAGSHTVNLSGYSLQYAAGSTASGANDGEWAKIDLSGSIPPAHSFLVVGNQLNSEAPQQISGGDLNIAFTINNRAAKVILLDHQFPIAGDMEDPLKTNPFNTNGSGMKVAGYIDMAGAVNETGVDFINGYEKRTGSRLTGSQALRRRSTVDHDDNTYDFESVDYRVTGVNSLNRELKRPKNLAYGAWDPFDPASVQVKIAGIESLTLAGASASTGTPAASYSAVTDPGSVTISGLLAASAEIVASVSQGASYRTAKVTGSGAPQFGNATSLSFVNGDFLYIEVTSADRAVVNIYKIAVTVRAVFGAVTLSGTYTLNLNPGANPQQKVVIEAYDARSDGILLAAANADITNRTWSMQVPLGYDLWFRVAVTDSTGYTFGNVVSANGQSYNSDTENISLTLGPFAAPELTRLELIDATAVNGVKQNKTAPGTNTFASGTSQNTIDQGTGEIVFGNTSYSTVSVNTIINFHALAANFTVSQDSKLYVGNVEQVSGVTTNNYNNEVVFTVVSGDNVRKTYRVAGAQPVDGVNLPGVRSVVGTTNFQTQGFGIMNIETDNKTLGLPTSTSTGKLNIVWNPTGTYTYISPEGRVQKGGTDIKARGNWTVRFENPKSFTLRLNTAAGFDRYDDKTNSFVTMPANRRWTLLINSGDSTRIKASVCFEMGRRILTGMGWQPNTDWVFVFLNGNYQGLYMLCEQIRIDEGRLNIGPEATVSNPNGGFIVEMNNVYWYVNDLSPFDAGSNLVFDEMYNFMTAHQGIVWSFSSPGSGMGWYYPDPPDGNGNLDYSDTVHFPRKGIAMRATLASGSAYNRPSSSPENWIVPNDFGEANGMGTPGMKSSGLYGSRTLSQAFPNWESSAFVKMSKFIQDAEDAVYSHDWVDKGYGNGSYLDYIDIDSFIDWHIAHEMAVDWEIAVLNGRYMHYDPNIQKLKMGPMWDMDKTFQVPNQSAVQPGFIRNSRLWYREILGSDLSSSLRDRYYIDRFKARWDEVKNKFNNELDPYIDAQIARFNRITGYNHPSGMSISGDRAEVKSLISDFRDQLDTVFSGY